MKPLEEHLRRNGGYTLCKPFQDGNGPGYIFTYTKNGDSVIVQRPVLHAENAYRLLTLKKMSGVMPDFKGQLKLNFGIAATFLKGISTDPFNVNIFMEKMNNVEITLGPLEIFQADETQLSTGKLTPEAISILRKYKRWGKLDGIYVVYDAVKTKYIKFRFKPKSDLGVKLSLPEIIEGLTLDPKIEMTISGDTMVIVSPEKIRSGIFIGYKDAAILTYKEGTELSAKPILKLKKTDFLKRKTLMK